MAIIILPDAQADLLALQDYMLARWTTELWLAAEDEIFNKLSLVDDGILSGPPEPLLASVGMLEHQTILTSHHRILYRQVDGNTVVYVIAAHSQDFQTLLLQRLFKR